LEDHVGIHIFKALLYSFVELWIKSVDKSTTQKAPNSVRSAATEALAN
jgi:hypothetical protein